MKPAFDCRLCGHCCEGRGGIVLGPRDLGRLCAYLSVTEADFTRQYAEMRNGKPTLRVDESTARCLFFRPGEGCVVHEAKPDVCRAWPFFRGNLVDEVSLDLAKEYCPGINAGISFAEFRRQGLEYLQTHGLLAQTGAMAPTALVI